MRWNSLVAVSLTALPALIEAHGIAIPKLVGRRSVEALKARNAFGTKHQKRSPAPEPHAKLEARQNTNGPCGSGHGSCAAGYCCSAEGFCGTGPDYCSSPDCQINYGTGCDGLQVPPGPATSGVARTKLGSVPYGGAGIYDCTQPGVIALTFDDGPFIYTSHILDILQQYNVHATFFITGNNIGKGQIGNVNTGYPAIIQRMYAAGHQIASHTWGHYDLSTLTSAQRKNQMYYNEIAFNDILGVFPTYMRPPFSSCTTACENDMNTLGYHITYFDLDTEDYLLDDPNLIQQAKNDFKGNISSATAASGADWLVISHDIHQQTAYNLTEYMIQTLLSQGYTPVTVGECLGDPKANWYRTLGGGAPYTSAVSSTVSQSSTTSSTSTKTSSTTTTTSTSTKTTSSTSTKTTSSTSTTTTKSTTTTTTTTKSTTTTSTTTSSAAQPTSTDGTCGGTGGRTCQGTVFGNCCSQYGWCGSTTDHCGAGCQSAFGTCTAGTGNVSPDATCGGAKGYTCAGSAFGNCCSVNGWCGSTSAYCGTGCQPAFGTGCT